MVGKTWFQAFQSPELLTRLGIALAIVALYRFGSHIPISGIDTNAVLSVFSQGGVLGFVNLFSGGGLSRFSIFSLGILPYINASIIIQLLMVVTTRLKEIAEEGESGRKTIAAYTRYLAVGLAVVQGLAMVIGFRSFVLPGVNIYGFVFLSVVSLVAGAALVMWLGELITEFGIGNGASLLIFSGIVAQMPLYLSNTWVTLIGGVSPIAVAAMALILIGMIAVIVFVQEAQRRILIQYAKRVIGRKMVGGQNTYLPLRLVQGGVLPIIFASAILQFPLYFRFGIMERFLATFYRYDGVLYNALFCFLIFFFTYFYTAIAFNPSELADNIKKNGGFIIGVRPGPQTVQFLERVIGKLTLVGAFFLAMVALVPLIASKITGVVSFMGLGGTAMLIIVGVALDLIRQVETFMLAGRYDRMVR